jgi:hypothetical protein
MRTGGNNAQCQTVARGRVPAAARRCGNSRNNAAVDACSKAIADKVTGKSFTLERKDMGSHAKDESTDVVSIASTIVFDKGPVHRIPADVRLPGALRQGQGVGRDLPAVQLEQGRSEESQRGRLIVRRAARNGAGSR